MRSIVGGVTTRLHEALIVDAVRSPIGRKNGTLASHRRAIAAGDDGRFDGEIVPIDLTNPHTGVVFAVDETPRRDTSAEALAALQPAFLPEGKVTAGNSSQICDGAAAVLVASED